MRKLGEVLFVIVAIIMVTFALSTNVKAAQEDSYGYEDFDSQTTESTSTEGVEPPANDARKTETTENKGTTEQTTNTPNTATTAHVQAGVFENTIFIAATVVLAISIGFGYKKFKKYNY